MAEEIKGATVASSATDLVWAVYHPVFRRMCGQYSVRAASGAVADLERRRYPVEARDGTAVIKVEGPIEKRATLFSAFFGGTSVEFLKTALNAAVTDDDIKRILLHIDSPGGSVMGMSELGDLLLDVKQEKPIVAYVDGMACSGAYWIASHANKIYAERTALIGSIGTYTALYDFSKWAEKEGIEPVVIKTGELKGAGIMGTEITEAQKEEFTRIVEFYFAEFVTSVAKGRGMTKADVKKLATGQVWPAPEAKSVGLIDGVMRLENLFASLKSRKRSIRSKVNRLARGI